MPTERWISKLGQRIRKYRMRKGLTLEKAGERYGVSRRTWSRYEKGMNLSVKSLRKIAKVLGVKARDLLDD